MGSNGVHVVMGELSAVVSHMRRNQRWATAANAEVSAMQGAEAARVESGKGREGRRERGGGS